jgi:gas vesicle protein
MNIETEEYKNTSANLVKVISSVLIGGLAGTVTMWLLAPQSGKDTRTQIRTKSAQLRDWAGGIVSDTISKVRAIVNNIANGGRKKYLEIKQHSQELAVEQLDHLSEATKAGKKAVQKS